MSDCCGGLTVDQNYLCTLLAGESSQPMAVGAKILNQNAAGTACGMTTSLLVQTRLRFTANQATTSGTPLSVSWTSEDADPLNLITVPGTTLTIPTGGDGQYTIDFSFTLASAPTSTQATCAQIVIAGTAATAKGINRTYKQANQLFADQHINLGPLPLAAGDTILCQALQTTGGTVQASSGIVIVTWEGT